MSGVEVLRTERLILRQAVLAKIGLKPAGSARLLGESQDSSYLTP